MTPPLPGLRFFWRSGVGVIDGLVLGSSVDPATGVLLTQYRTREGRHWWASDTSEFLRRFETGAMWWR